MFNQYVYLNRIISFGATKARGITMSSGKSFFHGKLVDVEEVNVGQIVLDCGGKNFPVWQFWLVIMWRHLM